MPDHDAIAGQFIEAGIRTLVDRPDRVLDRGLRSEDVIHEAGASQATFYRRFAKKADFLDAVVGALTFVPDIDTDALSNDVKRGMANNGKSVAESIRAIVNQYVEVPDDSVAFTQHLMAHVFATTVDRAGRDLVSAYVLRDTIMVAGFDATFDSGVSNVRRPFTTKSLAVAVGAVLDGFRLRNRIEPGAASKEIVTDTVLAVLWSAIDPTGGHQHFDDAIGTIARPEVVATPRDPRAELLAAARIEFGKRGYFLTQIDTVADAAGVPRDVAVRLFPSKRHILVAALRARVESIAETVADDEVIGLAPILVVENFLLRCAQLASDEVEFMDALLVSVAHDTYGEPEGMQSIKEQLNLPAIIVPVIERGQRSGDFADSGEPWDVAAAITNTLLLRCFTRRTATPEDNAAFIGNLVLRGLAAR